MEKELFDVLDENGNKTGKTKLRSEVHRDGDWHRAVHIWIINNNGDILLQRRCATKDSHPNMLDISSAGHLIKGDDSLSGAIRELKEELDLDIKKEELIFIKTIKRSSKYKKDFINNEFDDLYILRTDKKIEDMKYQKEEISEIIFVPYKEFKKMVINNQSDLLRHDEEFEILFSLFDNEFDKYNCSNCLNIQFNILKGMFFDTKEETEDYILCTSKVMDDYYWNLAYLKNKANDNTIIEIGNKLRQLNRVPCIYLGRDDKYYEDNKKLIISKGFELKDSDAFMIHENYKDVNINIKVKIVEREEEYNDFMKVLSSAYNDIIENSDENVYKDAIVDCYYEAVRMSIGNGKTYHIIGYDNGIPVSVATLNIEDEIGGINNVGTMQGYWNKGYSKQVLTYLINFFKEKGGKDLILCTEYNSKNETYYKKLGFKELFVMEQYEGIK